jgi:FHS family glucose/mannose:H+ symporter-like MFS transporter
MPTSASINVPASAGSLTLASYISFVPIGIATVLLGPMLPVLSERWSMNYSQAGALFAVQYVSSTVAVAFSGMLVSRYGFRFPIKTGLLLMAAGLALLMTGPKQLALICIAAYGAGLGLATPAGNLLVAELNPDRCSATLSWLNFYWSAGAVTCPFLVAYAAKVHQIPLLLACVSAFSLLVALVFAVLPAPIFELAKTPGEVKATLPAIQQKLNPFLILAALFFLYVGTENAFGGWVASFAKSLGNLTPVMALLTPSFFYAALTFGRCLAPILLRDVNEIRLVQIGLVMACFGTAGLMFARGLAGVAASACAAGLGLSYVYPITISVLSREFGSSSSAIASVMFVLSNIGGGSLPWIVGVVSHRYGSLKGGLLVPLLGCAAMSALYFRDRRPSYSTNMQSP